MRNTFVNFKKLSENIAQARNFLFHDGEERHDFEIKNLNRINVFIGQNNSGKSRLMRTLFMGFSSVKSNSLDSDRKINTNHFLKKDIEAIIQNESDKTASNYPNNEELKRYMTHTAQVISAELNSETLGFEVLFDLFNERNEIYIKDLIADNYPEMSHGIPSSLTDIRQLLSNIKHETITSAGKNAVTYIPALRNIRSLGTTGEGIATSLKFRTFSDYFDKLTGIGELLHRANSFNDGIKNDVIFSGENLYHKIKALLLSYHEHRVVLANFENFLSDTFFNGERVSLMPIEIAGNEKKELHVKIGGEKERPIYELGDGINYIIILTFPLFLYENERHYLFIEEPELHLHPGLQRVFMKCLERFTNTQVYITTHSNHILDMTLEMHDIMSVYTFHKKQDEEKKEAYTHVNHVSTSDQNILDLIGVRNSSVFLANCTIWVEGISDVLYIRKYLELYMQQKDENDKHKRKQYLEGIHFAFIEYGGSNLVHWSFIENSDTKEEAELIPDFISSNRFLVCDKDNTGKDETKEEKTKKEKRYDEYEAKLGDKFHKTDGIEVENMIPFEALNATIKDLKNIDVVADSIEDYKNERLGEFLLSKTGSGTKYWNKEGKLQNKAEFARLVIKHVSDLPEPEDEKDETSNLAKYEAFILARKLYGFIAHCNSN